MTTTKRKVSVSLDEELVAELEAGGEALSSQVNDAVRSELARRRRQRLLDEILEEYERTEGPPDEALGRKVHGPAGVSRALVLDTEALSSLSLQQGTRFAETRAALEAARRLRRDVVVPTVILAELYRGPKQNQVVDSCLSRETGLSVRDTDREFARLVGSVLGAAKAGSVDLADAHCIAAAVEAGGGVVVTGDDRDLGRLAAPYPNVQISPI